MQLLLYAPTTSPRLQYICNFIFKEMMLLDFLVTTDQEVFSNHQQPKIKYANEGVSADHLSIGNHGLLFENDIRQQPVSCFESNHCKVFFKTENADLSFDILSASFYLLSRYEEYLPHTKDIYGRYAHQNSLAFKENFLPQPLVNIWIGQLKQLMQIKFPGLVIQQPPFTFLPTYDIDMAFSFRHKGWLRNTGSFFRSPSFRRVKVLLGLNKDPFDCYDWLNELHNKHHLHPVYFFLLAEKNATYDKNILPHKKPMQELIHEHAKRYTVGIHPSWQSGDKPALQGKEKALLEAIIGEPVLKSRQHYIRFTLPDGYRKLQALGILDDYSMGYGGSNGFRASVASSFYWFDLPNNQSTLLRIHPYCFMEANSFYEEKYTADEAYDELRRYYLVCKEVQGQMITIWHNSFLGTDPQFAGWRDIYERFIRLVSSSSS